MVQFQNVAAVESADGRYLEVLAKIPTRPSRSVDDAAHLDLTWNGLLQAFMTGNTLMHALQTQEATRFLISLAQLKS